MSKTTMLPNEIMEERASSIEHELTRLIEKALKERLIELSLEDIKIIARELMPDIDLIISKKIKFHFYEIGKFMVDKFDIGE